MGMEVVESNTALEAGNEANMSAKKLSITFGSHGSEEPAIVELSKLPQSNLPKDAVDEWPEPSQIHSFYIVKYRAYEDQNTKAKLDLAEKELQKMNQARSQIFEKLKTKRTERAQIRTQIHALSVENKQFRSVLDEKRKEMEPLQQALGKLKGSSGVRDRERGLSICSSEKELNDVIKSLQYRIQHESIPLSEEKQILREIKQLEGTRELVIANSAERVRIQESIGEKDAIQDQVKSIGVDLDGVRKEKQVIFTKIKQLDEEKLAVEKLINALEDELSAVTEKRDKILDRISEIRKQREEGNSPFYQNRNAISRAKVLAAKKDIDSVKEILVSEVEKFMALWSSNKAFRADYESRIMPSLDMRQFSKDGRMRNFDEKPLVQVQQKPTSIPSENEVVITKQIPKEDVVTPVQGDLSSEQKVAKAKTAKINKGDKKFEVDEDEYEPEYFSTNNKVQKSEVFDEKKLKALKREEELAKRQLAEERKKKQAEKAAAKEALKAQKNAEKKLKEQEKKARKKSGAAFAAADPEEPAETVPVVAEVEKVEENVEAAPAPHKNKERKEHTLRHRARPRGPDTLPKAILKRKKATNYLFWAAPAAAVVVLLLVLGYYYLI